MILWRISNHENLLGTGGIRAAGRWHNKGSPIVYLADHPALALLEVLVHLDMAPDEASRNYRLLEVDYPQSRSVSRLPEDVLRLDWHDDIEHTRSRGDEWLRRGSTALLRVPSAVVPKSFNYLLNPSHPEAAKAVIRSVTSHPYDHRLLSA